VQENQNNNGKEQNIWSLYLYAMKSPVTRETYRNNALGSPFIV
jgi:hypothetical protein